MDRARAIIILPSFNSGTRWELEQIAHNETYAKKSFIIVPPALEDPETKPALVEWWSHTIEAVKDTIGIQLPSLDRNGIYMLNNNGLRSILVGIHHPKERWIRKAVRSNLA